MSGFLHGSLAELFPSGQRLDNSPLVGKASCGVGDNRRSLLPKDVSDPLICRSPDHKCRIEFRNHNAPQSQEFTCNIRCLTFCNCYHLLARVTSCIIISTDRLTYPRVDSSNPQEYYSMPLKKTTKPTVIEGLIHGFDQARLDRLTASMQPLLTRNATEEELEALLKEAEDCLKATTGGKPRGSRGGGQGTPRPRRW
ncbi:hypothetical protein B0T13DRAFT_166173 [Neurospora crassa]|nr:hypothetical protein B0T13DRAFT_166173 [Neurospora crassa]